MARELRRHPAVVMGPLLEHVALELWRHPAAEVGPLLEHVAAELRRHPAAAMVLRQLRAAAVVAAR